MPHRPPSPLPRISDPGVITRFMSFVEKDSNQGNQGCWLWSGHRSTKGYSQMWMSGRAHWAHRLAWAIFRGDLAEGMTPDHVFCSNPGCVNPHHMELVSVPENSRRRWSRARACREAAVGVG